MADRRVFELIVEELLDAIHPNYSMSALVNQVAVLRGRRIELRPWKMTDIGEYGLWLATPEGKDFIFFDEQTAAVHQWQIIAHELAHMLLGHKTAVVGSASPISVAGFVLRRSQHSGRQERDAEMLATLFQAEIIKRAGLQALTSEVSSQPAWAGFIKGTGVE